MNTRKALASALAVQAPFAAWVATAVATGDRFTASAILGVLLWLIADFILLLGYAVHLVRRP